MNDKTMTEIRKLLANGINSKIPYEAINERFEAMENTSAYGDNMDKWIPEHEYVHNLLIRTISPYCSNSAKVLDLGAGTGRVSKLILGSFAESRVTLAELSENMLEEVPHKLKNFPDRYEIVQGDFFGPKVQFRPESFDCAVSVFAICHGREERNYRELYQKIHSWLKPSSCFVCFDHVYGATIELTELGFQEWGEFMEPSFSEEVVYEITTSTITEDSPISLSQHLELLTQAGFEAVDVLWKKNVFALYIGLKR